MKCLRVLWLCFVACLGAEEPARDTTTGRDFENQVEADFKEAGYNTAHQVLAGTRPDGGRHYVDVVARKEGRNILVSLKWQQAGGTAEQKIPYEMICLAEAIAQSAKAEKQEDRYTKALLVLGGDGWTLKEWYLSGELKKHLPAAANVVQIHSYESFLKALKAGEL
ncbi:MAG: PD-(D/E)XK nuclease superfamily protein [Verrucomicrobiales bacterium]